MVYAMGGCCQICGYSRCLGALEFHHLDSTTKSFGLGMGCVSWRRAVEELRKCVLVCSCCHAELRAGLILVPSSAAAFNEQYAESPPVIGLLQD
jgi:hypothetical protein